MRLTGTMRINPRGHLEIGGVDTIDLVREFGTPLWVIDEQEFRQNCRSIKNAFDKWGDSLVVYAGKSLCCLAICQIINEEGIGLDVVSGGELYTAIKAGFPSQRIYFHGNNKSQAELEMALEAQVGRIVVDNFYELELLEKICKDFNRTQDILIRAAPGVEAHTHEYIRTGQIDSKFGFTLPNGQALEAVKAALDMPHLNLVGVHCHIGSQVFEMDSFRFAAQLMMDFMEEIRKVTGYELDELDIGGGFGIYYQKGDTPCRHEQWAEAVMQTIQDQARQKGMKMPRVVVEPGRAISGSAGITLYTVGSYKEIAGVRKYVSVDGGMTDNPRPALYDAKYPVLVANQAEKAASETVSIAGKCCESGDMLLWDVKLPQLVPGDILAVLVTGAYNYAMSSNYNRLPRPAMVLVNQGKTDLIIQRETYRDLIRNDLPLERLNK